jgi:large subunit ribosomal protein L21
VIRNPRRAIRVNLLPLSFRPGALEARPLFVMYAVVRVGGKQYRVEKGDSLLVDRMRADEGAKVALEPLLFADGDKVAFEGGDVEKVKVEAVVRGHERGKKVRVVKFKPKRGYKRTTGHRSELTRLEISDIKMLSRKRAGAAKKKEEEAEDGS